MKATYHDFLNENPKCGRDLATNTNAVAIFDLLSRDRNIIAMADASDAGKPAIAAVVLIIEAFCARHPSESFDLANEQRRTVVGCMIKTILSRFGYEPVRPATRTQKELSRAIGARYFASGSCYIYEPLAPASMRIVRTTSIEPAKYTLIREIQCPYCKSTNHIDLQNERQLSSEVRPDNEQLYLFNFYNACGACGERFKVSGHNFEIDGSIEDEKISVSSPDEEVK
jgi:hypothetical protein